MIHYAIPCFALAVLTSLVAPTSQATSSGDRAQGTLVVQAEDKPLHVDLKHAYLVIGPDAFEPNKTTRRLVFAADDLRAAIEACKEIRCATMISNDGLVLDLDDAGPRYWAHVQPMQYSGSLDARGLVLRTDSPDRLAGTLMVDNSGVTTTIEFDAPLVKSFGPVE
ncbi:hypothetical protein [Dokdonella sp.]|uniref:hypothetical protein n=1 Tax=Dokdonella sp. TaxID=2291710 RepID=UPI003783DF40